jgi:hypothetical protein
MGNTAVMLSSAKLAAITEAAAEGIERASANDECLHAARPRTTAGRAGGRAARDADARAAHL